MNELPIAIPGSDREIRINFGLLAGRDATSAEIEELAKELHARLEEFSVISEHRFRFGTDIEASVHQVRIEADEPLADELRGRVLEIAERWVTACAAERHADVITPYPGSLDAVELQSR